MKELNMFEPGDYVVHIDHGIGKFAGLVRIPNGNTTQEVIKLVYQNDDVVFVSIHSLHKISKYKGKEGEQPRISKLGTGAWEKIKERTKTKIKDIARDLIKLYSQRKQEKGFKYSPDSFMQHELEASFLYEDTPDQLKATQEVKADMESDRPMDRLVCGDVGFGKTEVAIRAAFKAVADNKQVAVLVPTTVLAYQHYQTFCKRLEGMPCKVEYLSRARTAKDTSRILKELEAGTVNILIGTHKIIGKSVKFHDLGLLIIDEEQKFGVSVKEKLRQIKVNVDTLTMTATPIPRTLHMALVNGRDMSVIESPPEDRLPVETYVSEYNDGMIKEALERELRRGGRIYYISNRVSALEPLAAKLRRLVPGISIKIAHGQMNEDALEDAMITFYEGGCDVLLCTTIVENGLDVPLANTIIIDGADNFGLSQLYQMRGRVGRSSRLAYAYFVYQPNKALSEIAEKRLQAIRDFTELGAGFKIAMRDLEIRGAGNLLGPQQHGHITGIGFAAYCEMLEKTIERLKNGKEAEPEPEPVLEIQAEAYIPDSYIPDPRYKMELYRRFSELEYSQREDFLDEIIDRFGNPPPEVEMLWRLAALKGLCRVLKIRGVNVHQGIIRLTFGEKAQVNPEAVLKLLMQHPKTMTLKNGQEQQLTYRMGTSKQEPLAWLEQTLPALILED